MIYSTEKHILRDAEDYSVILHQVNTRGTIQQGIGAAVSKMWPDWFIDYHGYCQWFMKDGSVNFTGEDHADEIVGTWHKYDVPGRKLKICSAFGQIGAGKDFAHIDLEAWDKILRKLVNQTRYVNKKLGTKWTIHVPASIGILSKNDDNEELMDLFKHYFESSDVDLYIHQKASIDLVD